MTQWWRWVYVKTIKWLHFIIEKKTFLSHKLVFDSSMCVLTFIIKFDSIKSWPIKRKTLFLSLYFPLPPTYLVRCWFVIFNFFSSGLDSNCVLLCFDSQLCFPVKGVRVRRGDSSRQAPPGLPDLNGERPNQMTLSLPASFCSHYNTCPAVCSLQSLFDISFITTCHRPPWGWTTHEVAAVDIQLVILKCYCF